MLIMRYLVRYIEIIVIDYKEIIYKSEQILIIDFEIDIYILKKYRFV